MQSHKTLCLVENNLKNSVAAWVNRFQDTMEEDLVTLNFYKGKIPVLEAANHLPPESHFSLRPQPSSRCHGDPERPTWLVFLPRYPQPGTRRRTRALGCGGAAVAAGTELLAA